MQKNILRKEDLIIMTIKKNNVKKYRIWKKILQKDLTELKEG
jgi:hypothetical protein